MTEVITGRLYKIAQEVLRKAKAKQERFARLFPNATERDYERLQDKHYMEGRK